MSPQNSPEPLLRTAEEVSPDRLRSFLEASFGPQKAEFLHHHGSWWHRGEGNRWVIQVEEEIAAYCAVTPIECVVGDQRIPALWWMDLVVAPAFRGRGLQTLFDVEVRRRAPLLLGFPNELAARIHRKHGWGVREDLKTLLLPLDPPRLNAIATASGWRGRALRLASRLARPAAGLWRGYVARYRPKTARRLERPTGTELAAIAARGTSRDQVTTLRDADFFQWRYLEMPFRDQLEFYVAGPSSAPEVGLICRHWPEGQDLKVGSPGVRILDLFGNLEQERDVEDVIRLASAAAAQRGAHQVTILVSRPASVARLRNYGFFFRATSRFCWSSESTDVMSALDGANHHWGLGDSDNDDTR
ncbi:MAG: GNAT family N-acetyltransferase [Deltaproteobacteria bacterium]|nr:GNAT family N-acetyltransferase [Deltaproteobacteria bacterium]